MVGLPLLCAAVLLAGAGGAQAANPDLLVTYDTTCHFTMSINGTTPVTSGTSIPYGSYQVIVSTPFSLSAGGAACDAINFSLTGPGVSYTTTLGDGDGDQDVANAAFQASASYTASDSSVSPGTTVSFSTTGTQASSVTGPGSASSSTSSGGGSESALGTPISSTAPANLGTLSGAVSAAGKLSLTFKGHAVATLKPGDYTLTVDDKSAKSGFVIVGGGHTTTVTTVAYKGKKSTTVDLKTGQWYFATKPGGVKTYFIVET